MVSPGRRTVRRTGCSLRAPVGLRVRKLMSIPPCATVLRRGPGEREGRLQSRAVGVPRTSGGINQRLVPAGWPRPVHDDRTSGKYYSISSQVVHVRIVFRWKRRWRRLNDGRCGRFKRPLSCRRLHIGQPHPGHLWRKSTRQSATRRDSYSFRTARASISQSVTVRRRTWLMIWQRRSTFCIHRCPGRRKSRTGKRYIHLYSP